MSEERERQERWQEFRRTIYRQRAEAKRTAEENGVPYMQPPDLPWSVPPEFERSQLPREHTIELSPQKAFGVNPQPRDGESTTITLPRGVNPLGEIVPTKPGPSPEDRFKAAEANSRLSALEDRVRRFMGNGDE